MGKYKTLFDDGLNNIKRGDLMEMIGSIVVSTAYGVKAPGFELRTSSGRIYVCTETFFSNNFEKERE